MSTLREGLQRMRSFFQKEQQDAELDAEVAEHLELAVEENLRQGMPAEEARRQALLRFGGVAQAKEQQREARGLPWVDVLLQDVRFTLRSLGRDRAAKDCHSFRDLPRRFRSSQRRQPGDDAR